MSGALEGDIFYDTLSGTPQGGLISPTLANIVLSGLEKEIKEQCGGRRRVDGKVVYPKVNVVRFADDFVVTCNEEPSGHAPMGLGPEQASVDIIKVTDQFLMERGLVLNKKKTKVTRVAEGFDFLGFNFRA